ncbi:hypothetical protein [Planctopirus hydrillae]|uniref:hypothetical protein n=1 Tax=Planctopirus hydrillae TaxID=1841610 RepID=UPI0013F4E0D6|nr:hypothetical protein [Planctopirus hydrillae]
MAHLLRSAPLRKRLGLSLVEFEALPADVAEEWLVCWELIQEEAARKAKQRK